MQQIARRMYKLFSGRMDTYGLQRQKGNDILYIRVAQKELLVEDYISHLEGQEVLGIYPLREDGTCVCAALDVDASDFQLACDISQMLPSPNYIEQSRSGNYHVWMFFKEPGCDAEMLHDRCTPALRYARDKTKEHCQLYPTPQPPGRVGLLIALPFQFRLMKLNRTVFFNGTTEVHYENHYDLLSIAKHAAIIGVTEKVIESETKTKTKTKLSPTLEDLRTTMLNNKKMYQLYIGEGKTRGDRSQSGYDFAFTCVLFSENASIDIVEELLRSRPRVHSLEDNYIRKTLEAARTFVQKRRRQKNGNKRRSLGDTRSSLHATGTNIASTSEKEKEKGTQEVDFDWESVNALTHEQYFDKLRDQGRFVFKAPQVQEFEIFYAALLANLKMTGRPVWLMLVGPPGSGKTMPMMAIGTAPCVYMVSAFRPAALISGWGLKGGEDMSLIPKLEGKILLVKDMSSLLSQNRDVVAEILGLLRDAYDGQCAKVYGTGVVREYKSRFGFIGATTPEIDANWALNIRLGERFIRYRVRTDMEQVYEKIDATLNSLLKEDEHDLYLEEASLGYLKYLLREDGKLPYLSNIKEIGRLAQLGAILRTGVSRASFTSQILVIPEWEEATRFAKQLAKMAISLAYIRDKERTDEQEIDDLKCLVRDGLDSRVEAICRVVYKYSDTGVDLEEVSKRILLPQWTVRTVLSDLEVSRIIVHQKDGFKHTYRFTPWLEGQLDHFQLWPKAKKGE